MKPWLYRHRHAILMTYGAVALTVILILQVLEARGLLP